MDRTSLKFRHAPVEYGYNNTIGDMSLKWLANCMSRHFLALNYYYYKYWKLRYWSSVFRSYCRYVLFHLSAVADCGIPDMPSNGVTSYTTTTYLSVADYTCNVGYTRNGVSSRTCQANEQWTDSAPVCDSTLNGFSLS